MNISALSRLAAAAALCSFAGLASAQTYSTEVAVGEIDWTFDSDSGMLGPISSSAQGPANIGSGHAIAQMGITRSRSQASVDKSGSGTARSESSISDHVLFNAPGHEFKIGVVKFRVGAQGVADAHITGIGGSSAGAVESFYLVGCSSGTFTVGNFSSQAPSENMDFLNHATEFEAVVIFGVDQFFYFRFRTEASASGGAANQEGTAVALADIIARWGGIIEIRDQEGNLIDDVTITSDSGFDYHNVAVSPCPADINSDGVTDLTDFFAFFNAFDAAEFAAEVDPTPGVDLGDFFTFLNSFDAGCA